MISSIVDSVARRSLTASAGSGAPSISSLPQSNAFITVWETTTPSETITVPADNIGTYNAVIDWGDGSTADTITAYNDADLTHTYTDAGEYVVSITGTFPWIRFNNAGDKLKIKEIRNWGNVSPLTMSGAFYGCSNMIVTASDTPDWSTLNNIGFMFRNCTSLNSPLDNLDVDHVLSFSSFLRGATSFDQSLAGLDISSATNLSLFANGVTLSTANYDATLIAWEALGPNNGLSVDFGSSTYTSGGAAATARASLVSTYGWTIVDGGAV